jgi:RND family efflux transporter MFP subunit
MDNAIRIQLGEIFNEVGTIDYPAFKLSFSCFCDQIDLTVNEQRGQTEQGLIAWQGAMSAVTSTTPNEVMLANLQDARQYLQTAKIMLENLSAVLNHPTVGLPTDTAAAHRASVSAARTIIIAAQVSVASQEQAILTYKLAADRASNAMEKIRNGSTAETLAVQRALLQSAQAQADRVSILIGKNYIISPIAGMVTRQDAKVGQNATANIAMVSVISDQKLEMEANVPEVDIGKVSIGDDIELTVDALPGETLHGHVTFIDPAETVIDGVVNFRILAQLEQPDERLKSGLTVNMDIVSERRDDVLLLPQFAIIENNDGTFVRRPDGTEVPVAIGIRSQDGMVEISSGLSEGDQVLNIGLKTSQ